MVAGAVAVGAVATWLVVRPEGPATVETAKAFATAVDVSGNLSTHDPALVAGQDGEPWYVFSTGAEGFPAGSIHLLPVLGGVDVRQQHLGHRAALQPDPRPGRP